MMHLLAYRVHDLLMVDLPWSWAGVPFACVPFVPVSMSSLDRFPGAGDAMVLVLGFPETVDLELRSTMMIS